MPSSVIAIARRMSFIRETEGPNRGAWVSFLQRFCGGADGDSWCCDFVSFVEDVAYHGLPPTRRTGSCQLKLESARRKGLVVDAPLPGDLAFFLNASGLAHHVAIITRVEPLGGIAGNTSQDGKSVNGTGVFEHSLPQTPMVFVRLPGQ